MKNNSNNQTNATHPLKSHQQRQRNKGITYFIILFLLIVFFTSSLIILTGVYYWKWENQFIIKLSQKIPIPVLLVNKKFIWLDDYYKDLTALTKFYTRQFPLEPIPEGELKIQTLSKLIEKKLIEQAADEFRITVADEEVEQETYLIQQSADGQNINDLTLEIFGWDFNEFTERVIRFEILTYKINDFLINDQDLQKNKLNEINNLKNQLDQGVDFDALASYIGWFNKNEIVAIILNDIDSLETGQITNMLETDYGYYIIKLINKIESTDSENSYELSQIFVKKYDLSIYIQEQLSQTKIYRFINI